MNDISITFIKDGKEITKKLVPYGTPVSVITGNFGIHDCYLSVVYFLSVSTIIRGKF